FNFSAESVAMPEGRVNMYHHLVETLKFARGQRWRLRDPRSHPKLQNASQDLLGETLAQLIRQQIDAALPCEPAFSPLQEVQRGLQDRGQNQTQRPFFLNVVQAVSQEGACVYAVSDLRKGGEAAGY
ncbi:PREDICTED: gamma-glutamyltransferase 5-like, partial [Colobus angolensis palliatus]|uniref:gamma-glutamyltransferase 5-like n=1 Tax=Colobus angolensis palliatus TaxID=336983 RepID=UPI0005F3BD15